MKRYEVREKSGSLISWFITEQDMANAANALGPSSVDTVTVETCDRCGHVFAQWEGIVNRGDQDVCVNCLNEIVSALYM